MQQQQRGDLCVWVDVYVGVCVCSWGVAAQQRRIRAIAQASTSICYAVKMHKNPETETGIYLNLCRYNVILHYPKNDGVGGFPTQLSATLLLRLCVPGRIYVCMCICVCVYFYTSVHTFCRGIFMRPFFSATDLNIFVVLHIARGQNVSSFIKTKYLQLLFV